MANKKLSSSSPIVYSTDTSFIKENNKNVVATLPAEEQQLKITVDKKQRAGKVVTLITGFEGKEEDVEKLSKQLKTFCGTGGSVKDNTIIIQGDNKEKVFQWLHKNGYKLTKKN